MPRQTSAVEFSNFVAGLITEASPLTFPNNASLDERNFVLRRDGSRRRRLGIDFESGYQDITTSVALPPSGEVAIKTFRWENVGGDAQRTFSVVQVGNEIRFFDTSSDVLSAGLVYTHKFDSASLELPYSFASVDGALVVANGTPDIQIFEYKSGSIERKSSRLLVRDLFGVEDIAEAINLREGSGITTRPSVQTDAHIYNLRNQTWAEPRKIIKEETVVDLIANFRGGASNKFPSNSDVTTYSIYPDSNDGDDRLTDRFNRSDVINNPIGTTPAPRGYFIIDALSRGTSRLEEVSKLKSRYPQLQFDITDLPKDTTPGGATVLCEYAGRIFYSGFSGEVVDGDSSSPKMSSYILFSKLVEDSSDINACYQSGDPTSKEEPDLLDTDGGFIRLDGAYGIMGMVSANNALLIVARNGVWALQGGSDYGFKATNYLVSKVSDYGCVGSGTIVQIDNGVMFWGEDGIYVVAQNQFGDYVADNLTQKTIQTYYENIETLDKQFCQGLYDSYERKVTWTFGNRIASTSNVSQLIFDTTLGAFYVFSLKGGKYPMAACGARIPPYRLTEVRDAVTVDGEEVTASGVAVTVKSDVTQSALNEAAYVTITGVSPTVSYTFSKFSDNSFRDWATSDGVGFDAKAYLITGWMSAGDFQRHKQVPYITFHFVKTEDGFEEDETGDWVAANPSSCLVSSQWEWSNNISSKKWSSPFQAYRFKRHYFPGSLDDGFDNGFYTVVTKNKLRGRGRVVSLKMETEPGKDCYLLGWSMIMSANSNV